MYVHTSRVLGLGFVSTAGDDPAQIFRGTVEQAKERSGMAALFGLAILAGIGVIFARSGRR